MITKETQSTELLTEIFKGAYFDCHRDSDGDLVVKGEYDIALRSNKSFVTFTIFLRADPKIDVATCREVINKSSLGRFIPRTMYTYDGSMGIIIFDWALFIGDGLSAKDLITAFRLFEQAVRAMSDEIMDQFED